MDISTLGNPKLQMPQAVPPQAAAPSAAEVARAGVPALVVSENGAKPEPAGIPATELEKASVRTDDLGRFVDRALESVPTDQVDKAVAMLMEADYKAKKAVIDNLKPSEREEQLIKDQRKRVEREAEERAAEEVEFERRCGEMSGLPVGRLV